jgi:hypothetical protein
MLIQRFLRINPREVDFERRGFTCSNADVRTRLENVGRFFLQGYHFALQEAGPVALVEKLNQVERQHCGFAYEGAAMALALMDELSFRGERFTRFLTAEGSQHVYMLHVGAGWAYARIPWMRWRIETVIKKLHPVLRWLVMDGYGFHEGYFHGSKQKRLKDSASRLSVDARHVFYQGLGRSLWFAKGADVQEISDRIALFPLLYHNDAWSGIGLACAYAGGMAQNTMTELRHRAGIHASALAQGAAFAAKARQLAGNPAQHTEVACAVLCQMQADEAAALCDTTFGQIDMFRSCPYQHWRELMQQSLLSASEIFLRGDSHESSLSPLLVATKFH